MKRKIYQSTHFRKMIYAALFLAIALVLPFLTGQIPEIGKTLNPMHLPVFLCGFVLGIPYGAAVGAVAPLLRMLLFGMPAMPTALTMAFELAAYGALSGLFYHFLPKRNLWLYPALLASMLGGRVVLALVQMVLHGVKGTEFSFFVYIGGNIVTAIPGLVVQILLVPPVVILLKKLPAFQRK